MPLPLTPPLLPQLAKPGKSVPVGSEWSYEPKWDGYRAIIFVDGTKTYVQSRNGKPLMRYFPELQFPEGKYVLDGEIVVLDSRGEPDFDLLGQRIHPAESRVRMLAEKTPATFIAFDVLAVSETSLLELAQHERRTCLQQLVAKMDAPPEWLEITPSSQEVADTEAWLRHGEGVIAKQRSCSYKPGERVGMVKIKRLRTIDAVVRGWRPGKEEGTVGSLILGLYDENGELHEVGHTSGFRAAEKRELVEKLRPFETGERGSGEPSRWTAGRDLEWVMLRPELVVEVTFDHVSNGRIRHGAKILRWRDDKDPASCAIAQLDQ